MKFKDYKYWKDSPQPRGSLRHKSPWPLHTQRRDFIVSYYEFLDNWLLPVTAYDYSTHNSAGFDSKAGLFISFVFDLLNKFESERPLDTLLGQRYLKPLAFKQSDMVYFRPEHGTNWQRQATNTTKVTKVDFVMPHPVQFTVHPDNASGKSPGWAYGFKHELLLALYFEPTFWWPYKCIMNRLYLNNYSELFSV